MIVAHTDLNTYSTLNGFLSLKEDSDIGKKGEKIAVDLVVDDLNGLGDVDLKYCKYITTNSYDGIEDIEITPNSKFKVYLKTSIEEVESLVESLPDDVNDKVVVYVALEDGYCDMRTIDKVNEKYPDVRFTGGNLLQLGYIPIGRTDDGKDKMGIIFNGQYDTFKEVDLSTLEYNVSVHEKKDVEKKTSKGTKKKSPAKKKPSFFSEIDEELEF